MMIDWKKISEVITDIKKKIQDSGAELPDNVLESVSERSNAVFNPIEALDAEQVKTYNEFRDLKNIVDEEMKALKKAKDEVDKKINKMRSLENFFTSSIEIKHDLSNKIWRVNENTGMVEVFDQERAMKEMKEMGFNAILPPNLFGNSDNDE